MCYQVKVSYSISLCSIKFKNSYILNHLSLSFHTVLFLFVIHHNREVNKKKLIITINDFLPAIINYHQVNLFLQQYLYM